ncbi:MAG: hypothetical protein ACYS99_02210 [Planctomycetota bacterium]|jgi:hypothetical protein
MSTKDAGPLVEDVRTLVANTDAGLSKTLKRLEATLAKLDGLLSPDAPIPQGLAEAMKELAAAARSIRNLTSIWKDIRTP